MYGSPLSNVVVDYLVGVDEFLQAGWPARLENQSFPPLYTFCLPPLKNGRVHDHAVPYRVPSPRNFS